MRAVRERLWIQTPIGGVARYENDYYQRVSDDVQKVAGNPWFICTLWFAEYAIAAAQNLGELDQALAILNWTAARALPSGVLAEQVHPYTGVPISVSPLTWSHATFVNAVMKYLERRAELMARPADLPAAGS
jgi:GH15 family glucan-1,4-alpha-glucosidase